MSQSSELFRERCCHSLCKEPACNVCANCNIFTYCNINGHGTSHKEAECRKFQYKGDAPRFDYRGHKICVIITGDPYLEKQGQFNNAITRIFPDWGCYFIYQREDERRKHNAEELVTIFCEHNKEEQFDFLMIFYNGRLIPYRNSMVPLSTFLKHIFSKLQKNIPILIFNYHTLYKIPSSDAKLMMGTKRYPNFGTKPYCNDNVKESIHEPRYYQLHSRLLKIWEENNSGFVNDINQNIYQVTLEGELGDPLVLFELMKELINSFYVEHKTVFITSIVNLLNKKMSNKCKYIKPVLTSYFMTLSITKHSETRNVKCLVAGQRIKGIQKEKIEEYKQINDLNTNDVHIILHNMRRHKSMRILTTGICDIIAADKPQQKMKRMKTLLNKYKNKVQASNNSHKKKYRKTYDKQKSKNKTRKIKRKKRELTPMEKLANKLDKELREWQNPDNFCLRYSTFVAEHFIRKISNGSSTVWQFHHGITAESLNYQRPDEQDTINNEFIQYVKDCRKFSKPFAARCEECHWTITSWTSVTGHVTSHSHRENVINKIIEAVENGVGFGPQFSPSNSNNKHLANFIESINILNIDEDISTLSPIELVTNNNINNKSFIVSDVDEQLLILISFKT
eukprot:343669_1